MNKADSVVTCGDMTNCTKNNLQKESNWLTAGPIQVSTVGHVINFAQDDFENDVLPILDTDGHMTNCTKNNLQKES